jgi:hypothetical protein
MSNSKKIFFGKYLPFRPCPKIQNSAPYSSSPTSRVSKKVCHIPVGQKLREEKYFLEKASWAQGRTQEAS